MKETAGSAKPGSAFAGVRLIHPPFWGHEPSSADALGIRLTPLEFELIEFLPENVLPKIVVGFCDRAQIQHRD